MFATTFLVNVLLATAAFAIPSPRERLNERVARRAAGLTRQSNPKIASVSPVAATSNATNAEFSSNWSGAVLVAGSVSRTVYLYDAVLY